MFTDNLRAYGVQAFLSGPIFPGLKISSVADRSGNHDAHTR